MPPETTLRIRQQAPVSGRYPIRLTLQRPGRPDMEAEAAIEFALTAQEQADLRWYLEDYLQRAATVEPVQVEQIEQMMQVRGEELYSKVLAGHPNTQAIWFAIREQLADLRIEITTGIAEAASIPWELLRDAQSASPLALRVNAFVRVQSNPNLSFVAVPPVDDGRLRLLYVACRPGGGKDVALRAVANRLLQDLGADLARFAITALRPPTFEHLQTVLVDAKAAGRPFHIVHFDGHGIYADLRHTALAEWAQALSNLMLGSARTGNQGYLMFEHPTSKAKVRPVAGDELGKLLHDSGVPVLVLNACQSAMHDAAATPEQAAVVADGGQLTVHDEVRAIGSLAQAVIDQGIPAVLGMRYSVFVVTAAQYIGELYAGLAKGRGFGQAASEGRKHLYRNPERWVGLQPRPLQDWFVPVIYEAMPLQLLDSARPLQLDQQPVLDPVQRNRALLRYVPDHGFVGRDETLLLLDRAFDSQRVVLLHAYAGQGKTTTTVEFARWYAQTGGLGAQPIVLFSSFETHVDLADLFNQVGQIFAPLLQANNIAWHAVNDPAARRNLVLQLLRLVPVLWIWDNVEPVAGFPTGTESQWRAAEQLDLADFLKQLKLDRASKVKLLLTSRRDEQGWLGGIPHRIRMPRMSAADAARLALSLGEERGLSRAEIGDWQPLLDYCAGNPLTLRVLAGQAVKLGLRSKMELVVFTQMVRDGEQRIEDADAAQGRDKSLGASLDYGFRHAFQADELPIIALLHLFQGTVDVDVLAYMGKGEHALAEVQGKSKEQLNDLLARASETGLLTHLGATYYTIHPALPWFLRQLFARHYDGQVGRSSASAALRAWVEAVGALGDYYHDQFINGNREVIQFLALEEANLLHARRLARRHGWWRRVISAMQGLRMFYEYQGRGAEWARLVAEIVPDYCTAADEPIPGRKEQYSLVMGYRVALAQDQERDLALAAALQAKLVAWSRQQAAAALALPADAALDNVQRNRIRTLGVSVLTLGHILREQGSGDCVNAYEESLSVDQRLGDTVGEAITHYNLGHAYKDLPAIRDLDAAEAAYQRSLELHDPNDALGQSRCIKQIGMVHYERFKAARQQNAPETTLLHHAQAAEAHYQRALALCPAAAIADLAPMYGALGDLYREIGLVERAKESYEKSVQYDEQIGNIYRAGGNRLSIAFVYVEAAGQAETPAQLRNLLLRARAYAQAAQRDFQHFQGRAAAEEAKAQRLLDRIEQALAALPQ